MVDRVQASLQWSVHWRAPGQAPCSCGAAKGFFLGSSQTAGAVQIVVLLTSPRHGSLSLPSAHRFAHSSRAPLPAEK